MLQGDRAGWRGVLDGRLNNLFACLRALRGSPSLWESSSAADNDWRLLFPLARRSAAAIYRLPRNKVFPLERHSRLHICIASQPASPTKGSFRVSEVGN